MLPAAARLTRAEDFRRATRSGVRIGRATLVLHVVPAAAPDVRVGFVVSKAVGGAVIRNRVKRRLRHLVAERIRSGVSGIDVVVRALPAAASQPAAVAGDLTWAWEKAVQRLNRTAAPGTTGVS